MKLKKRTLNNTLAVIFAAEAFAFLILYIPNYVVEVDSIALTYAVQFTNRLFSFVLPQLAATYLFSTACLDPRKNVLTALILSLPTLVYNIPYNYLVYLAQGNDSIESLSISLLLSAVNALVFALGAIILQAVMLIATVSVGKKIYTEQLPLAYRERTPKDMKRQVRRDVLDDLPALLLKGSMFDLTSPTVFAIFAASFLQFAVYLVREMIDIIAYLIEYVGDYRSDEIFYIVFVLVFIFLELFAAHAICIPARNIMARSLHKGEDTDEGDCEK